MHQKIVLRLVGSSCDRPARAIDRSVAKLEDNLSDTFMSLSAIATPYTYDILIEAQPDGTHQASVLGWADCRAVAATAAEAVSQVKELLSDRMTQGQIVRVKIEVPPTEHPWLKFAGIFKDDPMFDEVLEHIEQYRRALDPESC
jgi:hypothetical protein